MPTTFTCDRCGTTTDIEIPVWGGHHICPTCRDNRTDIVRCIECGEFVFEEDAVEVRNSDSTSFFASPDCASNFSRCAECNTVMTENYVYGHMGDSVIGRCCSSDYVHCSHCGTMMRREDARFDGNDNAYCDSCYERYRPATHIGHYHHQQYSSDYDSVRFLKAATDKASEKRFFGIENEIDNGGGRDGTERRDCSDELYEISEDGALFNMKPDGSLSSGGIEIVSKPMTAKFALTNYPWERIRDIAVANGYTSHNNNRCGLHVHVSRAGLGNTTDKQDLTIAHLSILLDRFWDELVKFSRRRYDELRQWACKLDCDHKKGDSVKDMIWKSKSGDGDRYRALNLTNDFTVEFRLFRGSLLPETNRATIQMVDTLCDFAMNNGTNAMWDVTFTDIINGAKPEYTELRSYCVRRGLIMAEPSEEGEI